MVVIKLIGGLGNQLFQYAAAKALALENKTELQLDISVFDSYELHSYGLNHFNIKQKQYKERWSKGVNKILSKLKVNTYYHEDTFGFNDSFFKLKSQSIILNGFFQSELYFKKYRNELLRDLKITSSFKQETTELLEAINNSNSVSIHIRRGDYLLHDKHNTSKKVYYKKAMAFIERKVDSPVYYLFSDDMEWVKENFKTNFKAVYVDCNDASSNYEDLQLMLNCKHNIIANSSFSWWGGWLNTYESKIVVAPQQWFNDATSDFSDVIPNAWIKL